MFQIIKNCNSTIIFNPLSGVMTDNEIHPCKLAIPYFKKEQ